MRPCFLVLLGSKQIFSHLNTVQKFLLLAVLGTDKPVQGELEQSLSLLFFRALPKNLSVCVLTARPC